MIPKHAYLATSQSYEDKDVSFLLDNMWLVIIGVPTGLQLSNPNLFNKYFRYLACEMNTQSLFYTIYKPRKNFISPIKLISNSLFMSSKNLLLASPLPPKIISSTNTIIISKPFSITFKYKLLSIVPLANPIFSKYFSNFHTKS